MFVQVLDDWMYVASVIDRLQLYIFLAIIIAGTVGILIHAPHIFDFIDQSDIIQQILDSPDGSPIPKDNDWLFYLFYRGLSAFHCFLERIRSAFWEAPEANCSAGEWKFTGEKMEADRLFVMKLREWNC